MSMMAIKLLCTDVSACATGHWYVSACATGHWYVMFCLDKQKIGYRVCMMPVVKIGLDGTFCGNPLVSVSPSAQEGASRVVRISRVGLLAIGMDFQDVEVIVVVGAAGCAVAVAAAIGWTAHAVVAIGENIRREQIVRMVVQSFVVSCCVAMQPFRGVALEVMRRTGPANFRARFRQGHG